MLIPDQERMRMPRHHWHTPRPQPPAQSYRIKSIDIQSRIEHQVAVTQVSQTFVNTGQRQIEATFVFPLPYDGAVDQMTFLVDGQEYAAKLLPADKARKIYEGYVRRNQDPALLEWMGQGMFKSSVFPIPAGAERTVELRYTQLLRQDSGVTDYLIPLSTAKYTDQPIESFSLRATINTQEKLKSVYSPTHDDIQVDRSGDTLAVVKFHRKNFIPGNDLRIMFSEDNQSLGANLVSYWSEPGEHGYFTLLVTPDIQKSSATPTRKTVLFVVDRSGSMNGKKIEQAREAAKFVLNNLREGDLFNIISYASEVESFEPELQSFDSQTRAAALTHIEGIFAGGSTNIDDALTRTFEMIGDSPGPTYIVFLTDGLPTQGETNELKIAANARQNNHHGARLISFGVGFDVNSRLLDRMTRENNGQSQYVRPDENLEDHVSKLYAKISAPVLTDVKISYQVGDSADAAVVNRVYPAQEFDLFAGQQLVLVGRYRQSGTGKLKIEGRVGEQEQSFDYDIRFAATSSDSRYGFCARLWAVRRIGEIIDLIDLQGKNQELIQELVDLSTKHGIVTPYTSYLADDLARPGDLADSERNLRTTEGNLDALTQDSGAAGFAQRGYKQQLKMAQAAPTTEARMRNPGAESAQSAQLGQGIAGNLPASQIPLPASPGGGGGGGGGGGLGSPVLPPGSPAGSGKATVRVNGRFTAYLKGNVLFASNATDVDPEKHKDQLISVERYSPAYFELLQKTSAEENQLLALQQEDEEMIVRLQGKLYWLK